MEIEELTKQNSELQAAMESQALVASKQEAKIQTLMDETKKATARAQKAEEARAVIQAKIDKAAKENGDHEAIANGLAEENSALKNENNQLLTQNKEMQAAAAESAAENYRAQVMAEAVKLSGANTSNEGCKALLTKEYKNRLAIDEGALKVLDKNGNLSASTIDQLTDELKNDYPVLFDGSQAGGGDAAGGRNGGGSAPKSLESCKGDKQKEAAYFREQLKAG